jgi:hypothetical protein
MNGMDEAGILIRFVLAVLATWRISHLLVSEDGPGGVIARLRTWLDGMLAGDFMDCFGCASLWVAIPLAFYVAERPIDLLLAWLALSAAAFLLERAIAEPLVVHKVTDMNEMERNDGMLRAPTVGSEPSTTSNDGRPTVER